MLLSCGALSCGSVCEHGTIYGHLLKRSPVGYRKGSVIDRLLRNKKSALCVLNKNASAKTPFKNIFGS